ncbi:unnamed protein product [Amoebophrya sp. A25]|nr:unnamed protein product [Amoebophrya sp. A25]|eukprot:GSA25T00023134001.1
MFIFLSIIQLLTYTLFDVTSCVFPSLSHPPTQTSSGIYRKEIMGRGKRLHLSEHSHRPHHGKEDTLLGRGTSPGAMTPDLD